MGHVEGKLEKGRGDSVGTEGNNGDRGETERKGNGRQREDIAGH